MGKKKRQKTKELSVVAIAEASSTGGETGEQQIQPHQAPRKRGRPRKIVVEITETEEKKTQPIEQQAAAAAAQGTRGSEDEQHGRQEEGLSSSAAACIRITKEEGVSDELQHPKGEPSRSRARRKSKPRKSS